MGYNAKYYTIQGVKIPNTELGPILHDLLKNLGFTVIFGTSITKASFEYIIKHIQEKYNLKFIYFFVMGDNGIPHTCFGYETEVLLPEITAIINEYFSLPVDIYNEISSNV